MANENTRRPNPLARAARALVAVSRRGVLCTLMPGDGYPYGSLVDLLPLPGGDVVLFLSRLAEHRRFLDADARVSLLVAPHMAAEDALARPRVTLVGRAVMVEERETFAGPYLELHPGARSYIAFPDFQFYRLQVERARYIAGFGQMGWISREAYGQD